MGSRRLGRELAVQALYRMAVTGEGEAGPLFWEHFAREGDEARQFALELVGGVTRERTRLDALVDAAAENWRVERIALVERCVLAVATWELAARPETPVSVIIDEAVEIARRFGEQSSPSFVNGVLDRVAQLVRAGEAKVPGR